MLKTDARHDLTMGGKEHQQKVDEIFDGIDEKGLVAVKELVISLTNKPRKCRVVDVAAFDSNRRLVELHLVSRLNKTGMMLKHEVETMLDLEEETGIKVQFHSFSYLDNSSNIKNEK